MAAPVADRVIRLRDIANYKFITDSNEENGFAGIVERLKIGDIKKAKKSFEILIDVSESFDPENEKSHDHVPFDFILENFNIKFVYRPPTGRATFDSREIAISLEDERNNDGKDLSDPAVKLANPDHVAFYKLCQAVTIFVGDEIKDTYENGERTELYREVLEDIFINYRDTKFNAAHEVWEKDSKLAASRKKPFNDPEPTQEDKVFELKFKIPEPMYRGEFKPTNGGNAGKTMYYTKMSEPAKFEDPPKTDDPKKPTAKSSQRREYKIGQLKFVKAKLVEESEMEDDPMNPGQQRHKVVEDPYEIMISQFIQPRRDDAKKDGDEDKTPINEFKCLKGRFLIRTCQVMSHGGRPSVTVPCVPHLVQMNICKKKPFTPSRMSESAAMS